MRYVLRKEISHDTLKEEMYNINQDIYEKGNLAMRYEEDKAKLLDLYQEIESSDLHMDEKRLHLNMIEEKLNALEEEYKHNVDEYVQEQEKVMEFHFDEIERIEEALNSYVDRIKYMDMLATKQDFQDVEEELKNTKEQFEKTRKDALYSMEENLARISNIRYYNIKK